MSETLFGMNPFVLTIIGATGDLARNKLFPSLFSLFIKKQLGEKFFIIGFRGMNYLELNLTN
jgi:glucose-6-phosphate 1-dehydrogenase